TAGTTDSAVRGLVAALLANGLAAPAILPVVLERRRKIDADRPSVLDHDGFRRQDELDVVVAVDIVRLAVARIRDPVFAGRQDDAETVLAARIELHDACRDRRRVRHAADV